MQSNALIKLTEERISDNNALQTFVQKAKELTNPIFPETVQFTDSSMKFGAAIVTVDTQLDQYGNNRDVYKNQSGGYCLHLSKINEIAQQTGIQIIDSRIIERNVDEKGRVVFISHQVRGRLRSIDGTVKEDVATGKYDYHRDCETYISKRDGKPLINMINGRRSHAEALAESNAKTRLFNKMVAKLPQNFTMDELKKPFLIPYVLEDKDEIINQLPKEDQDEVRKKLAMKRLGLIDTLYSPPAVSSLPAASAPPSPQNPEELDDTPYVEEQSETLSPQEQNKIIAEEFREATQKARTDQILKLVQEKNYQDPKGVAITETRVAKQSINNQINFIEKLLNLGLEEDVPL